MTWDGRDRRNGVRRELDRLGNGWERHQIAVLGKLDDLERDILQFKGEVRSDLTAIREKYHVAPCPEVIRLESKIKVMMWIFGAVVMAMASTIVALLMQ